MWAAQEEQLIRPYVDRWHLTREGGVTRTHTSILLPVGYQQAPAILKIVHRADAEEQNAPLALGYWNGQGAVRLLEKDGPAILIERADNDISLKSMVAEGKDDEATRILAETIRRLHAVQGPLPSGLIPLFRWFRALFIKAETAAGDANAPLYRVAAALARDLLSAPQDTTLLHGDIHHENVLHSRRGWLAVDPKGLIGERTYDAANILCNPYPLGAIVHDQHRLQRQATLLAEALGLDYGRLLAFTFVHACISVCWSEESGQDTAYGVRCMEVAGGLAEIH